MIQLNAQTYGKWKADIIQNIQSSEYDQEHFSPIFDFISDIKSTNIIRKPLSNLTDDFLKSFIPNVVSGILNTQPSTPAIDSNYFKLLKSISSLLPNLISSKYNEFIESSLNIVINQKSPFYSKNFSHYHSLIKTMATPLFLQQCQVYFTEFEIPTSFSDSLPQDDQSSRSVLSPSSSMNSLANLPQSTTETQTQVSLISINRIYAIFMLLIAFQKYLDNRAIKDFLQISFPVIRKLITSISDKDLRVVPEKNINRIAKNFLSVCSEVSLSHSMTKVYVNFNNRLINSGLLSKQYSGLKTIRELIMKNNRSTVKYIYAHLKKEKIIDNLLKNIHHELIKEFTIILREMIKEQLIEPAQIKQLWLTFIHQHQGTIEAFLSLLTNLAMIFTAKQTSILFDAMIETNNFPDAALNFIGEKVLKLNQSQTNILFNKLSEIYFKNNNVNNVTISSSANSITRSPSFATNTNNNSILLATISKIIPSDKENRMIIQDKCLHFIETQENIPYSFAILKEILVGIPEDSARSYFYTIINMPSINNVEFLDLIQRILKCINGQFTDEEFLKLNDLINDNFFVKYPKEVVQFWMSMINDKRLRSKMMLAIFQKVTSKQCNQDLFSFALFLFVKMNTSRILNDISDSTINVNDDIIVKNLHKCKGLEEIWSLIYRENDPSVTFITPLVNLYFNAHEKDRYLNFIEHCQSNLRCPGVLKALSMLIHEVEDGINKELLNIYPNRFLSDEDYYTINITGDCEMSIRVPKDISANSLFTLISYLLDKTKRSLTFSVNDQIFTKSDKIENGMTINVKSLKAAPARPPLVNSSNLPSMLIFNSSLCRQLFEIMTENIPILSLYSYELLSLLPTVEEEKKLANSKTPDWDTFLQTEKSLLFLYRSNIIGNRIISRDSEWYDRFITTQGGFKFINVVLAMSLKIPARRLVKLMRICFLITQQSHFESLASNFFKDFPSDSLNLLITVMAKNNDPDLISICLKFLSKMVPFQEELLSSNKELPIIAKNTFFHKNSQIRVTMRDIVLKLPLKIQVDVAVSLLPSSTTSKRCAEFFTLLKEIAKVTDDIKTMWNKLVEIFFKKFSCLNMTNPISKLEFEAPSSPFVNGIITVLIELTKRFDTDTYISDLFWFIVDNIVFNDCKYYEITPNFYQLLALLIQKEPKLADEIVEKFDSFKFPSSKYIPPYKLLSYNREKGLKNLGATCYMNSMLQQFFHITSCRDLILSYHFKARTNSNLNNDSDSSLCANTSESESINNNSNSNSNSNSNQHTNTTNTTTNTNTNNTSTVIHNNNNDNSIIDESSFDISRDEVSMDNDNSVAGNSESGAGGSSALSQTDPESLKNVSDENKWLFELQKLFAKLIYFPSSFIDTSGFVKVWKDWDGQPINPRLQQDAVEFLNMFLDRIDDKIPNISNLFKGEIVHSVVGVSQEYSTQTIETFVTFPLEVKDNSCVDDSLNTFISPDRFDGQNQYNAEGIGKIDAEIYSRVRKAPQVLIIQLKRFEYNLQTNAREKLNDRYTFYQELDFSPVMENPGDFVTYQLCGVTCHVGNALGGHYVSHVLTDDGWLTFDDENVNSIEEQEVLNSSYGGYSIVENWDDKGKRYVTTKVPKNRNAYLLFYRRVMLSVRDESSIFNFQIIQENLHTIDHHVLTSLLKDMKDVLNANVLKSSNFNDFLMKTLSFTQKHDIFLYNYLVFNLRNQRKSDTRILNIISNKIKELCSPEFADFLCSPALNEDVIEFLLCETSKEWRQLYLSLFQKAIPMASNSRKNDMMTFVLNEILNHGDFLMKNWMNFDEFFRILLLLIDRNTETWSPILFTFLLTSVYEFSDESTKKKMNVLRNIDLSAIFEILNIVIKKRNLYDNFKAQATDSNFLISFILSKYHCSPFIEFILSFNVQPEQVFQKVKGKIEATTVASFFMASLHLKVPSTYVINFVKKKDENFIKNFFISLTDRVLSFDLSNLNILTPMKPLLNNLFTSTDKTLRVAILEFLEAAQLNKEDMYNFLIGELQNVITVTDLISLDNNNHSLTQQQLQSVIPTQEYFEILKKTVILGEFQSKVIKNAKSFVDAVKVFSHIVFTPNLPIMNLMDFLIESLGSDNSEAFFKVASFSVFINSINIMNSTCDYSFLRNFLEFIPMSQTEAFFKHGVFINMAQVMFSSANKNIGNLLMSQILLRSNQNNCHLAASVLWSHEVFSRCVSTNGTFYFKTSWKLIKKYPSLVGSKSSLFSSAVFNGCLELVEKSISDSKSSSTNVNEIAPYAAKLLAVDIKYYLAGNRGKKSFFSQDPVEKLGKKMMNLKLTALMSMARHESKYCAFLTAISGLHSNISKKLFEIIDHESDGFLKKCSTKTIKNASRLISSVCLIFIGNQSCIPRIKAIVFRELVFATRSAAVEPLCEVISKLLLSKTIKTNDLSSIVQKIMSETNDPLIFTGGFSGLIFEVIRNDQSFATLWTEKAVLMLQELLVYDVIQQSNGKILVLVNFLNRMKQNFNVKMPLIPLTENEREIAEMKKMELGNNENLFDALQKLHIFK